jgi:phosphatidate cytidylyltransferase
MAGGLKRLVTAAVTLPAFFVIIKYLDPRVFVALVCAAAFVATHELHRMAQRRGIRSDWLLGALLTAAVVLSFAWERVSLPGVLAGAAMLVPLRRLLSRRGVEGAFESVSVTLGGVLFLGVTLGFLVRLMGGGDETGRDLTVLLFLVVWFADAGAYYAGTWFGRHPLSPTVSPNKTIEGAMGGLAAAVAAAAIGKIWFFRRLGAADAASLGVLLWAAALAGDLAESLLKRSVAVKDCGSLFPGHGGMLDRADSLLFGAPVLFFYYRTFMT